MSHPLTRAVRRALDGAPCPPATLARAAGVPQSTLSRVQAGEREATAAVAAAVARALRQWARECDRLAARIEAASLRKGRT